MVRAVYPGQFDPLFPMTMKAHGALIPRGITLHYTADDNVQRVVEESGDDGIGYHIIIDRQGRIIQTQRFDLAVWHAGKAMWRGRSPNREHIAIALMSWGELKREGPAVFKSWNGTPTPEVVRRKSNISDELSYWHAATSLQELALLTIVRWCVAEFALNPLDICDHSECALPKGRKVDIGGVISWSMPEFRQLILDPNSGGITK